MIPKRIHYCWFGPRPLSNVIKSCIKSWQIILPDYEINLWNEENSPMDNYYVQQAYKLRKYAFVSDYVRFWVLFNYGGIYLDTDMYVVKNFDDLLKNQVFFGWESEEKSNLSCGIVGSSAKNDFIGTIIQKYDNIHFSIESIPGLVVPRIVSTCYDNYPFKDEIKIYPYDYFYPFPYSDKENRKNYLKYKSENTYAIHLWDVSWGRRIDKLHDWILYHVRNIWRKLIQ